MNETMAQRIRQKRLERHLTQQQLASKVGVSRPSVCQWERDETSPKGSNLTSLVRALGVDIQWLQTGKNMRCENFFDGLSGDAVAIMGRIAELDRRGDERIGAILKLLGETDLDI